jgi:hypothetical protein
MSAMFASARRAVPALFRRAASARAVPAAFRAFSADGSAEGVGAVDTSASETEEKAAEVAAFLDALSIDSGKYVDSAIPDMATLLHSVKTEQLKKEGMPIKERKKLLSHVEKYKRGLWAPSGGGER